LPPRSEAVALPETAASEALAKTGIPSPKANGDVIGPNESGGEAARSLPAP